MMKALPLSLFRSRSLSADCRRLSPNGSSAVITPAHAAVPHALHRPPRRLVLLCSAAISLCVCWLVIEPFVEVVLGSAVLAIIAYPLHVALLRRTQKPSLSAMLTVLILIVIVLLPLVLVSIAIFRQAREAV